MKIKEKLTALGQEPKLKSFSQLRSLLGSSDPFEVKKEEIGTDLNMLLAYSETSRMSLLETTGWAKSRISKILSGKENLTLKTIFEVCRKAGYEFDVIFRKKSQRKAVQPWQHVTVSFAGSSFNELPRVVTTANNVRYLPSANQDHWINERSQVARAAL